ncbi:bifunctional DNA-formamidopyrimidine glycosylase/DNA-(apurinic or apyrimidinic site) lyase [Patescibacteria group bacterium]|nr:bifunctional DNA-formamidopyrimidine glycosylase/DNA-(apurinic or apyrimidinic site) lyase [Patescibacteria group bacterium]
MPELPEVQTIVNDLNKKVVGEIIVDFWSEWKKSVRPSFSRFKKEIMAKTSLQSKDVRPNISHCKKVECFRGAKIIGARRIGKQIIIDLDNKKTIMIHLKMSGHLLFKSVEVRQLGKEFEEKVNQYIHHIFTFKSGSTLEFSDLRKFGWLSVVNTEEVENTKEIQNLGIDALSPAFTSKKFKEILDKKQKSVIGTLLLDQHLIAGIGNIYRSEILFLAGVNPKRKTATLSEKEIEKIFKAIKSILKKAVKMRGTTDSDYRDTEGKSGSFQKVLNVYGREGKDCKKCKGKVIREKLGQRSIFFCPNCQK